MSNSIPNYQVPGVYVTQSGSSTVSNNASTLNIAIVADQVTPGTNTDSFYVPVQASGINIGALTVPMVNTTSTGTYTSYSGFTVTWVSGSTTVTGTYGVNFSISTTNGISYLTTSGVSASGTALPSGTVSVTYGHNWGAYGTYTSYNQVINTVGLPVSGTSVVNPASLGAFFAFQNGASSVTIMPVARISGTNAAAVSDWDNTFAVISGVPSTPTQLANTTGIDVVVPLYGFTSNGSLITTASAGTVANSILNYLTTQASYGSYQRAFLGVDGTSAIITANNMQTLANNLNSTRVSLVYPTLLNFNPGLNINTGLTNVNFNVPGYYLAAAIAGLFVGQSDVNVPVTNKQVQGFTDIPNQISDIDAATNYLPYGILTVRKKRDGNFWVLHGLTTNVTNWLTQEVSINAIGDRLAGYIKNNLVNGQYIGAPLTAQTYSVIVGNVQSTLRSQVTSGLIQSFQNISSYINPNNPTTIDITFQYAPTYPVNYIQVTFSLNTQTGQVINSNVPTNYTIL